MAIFHKPKLMKIFVDKKYVYILKAVFFILAAYFLSEIIMALRHEVIVTTAGRVYQQSADSKLYWITFSYYFSLFFANVFMFFSVREKIQDVK